MYDVAIPSRFRHPVDDPDPVVAKQYRRLFDRDVSGASTAEIDSFARALMRGDPLADGWLARAVELPRAESRRLFELAASRGIDRVTEAPSELCALFRQLEATPTWVDPEQLVLGARAFRRAGLLGMFVLSDFGLLAGYRSAAIAKTLTMTGKLRYGAAERLIQTGHFVTVATDPGTLRPGGSGYVAAARVRLVHAAVRRALSRAPAWNCAAWGLPINQADMLSTNLLFSIGFLEGCKCWGLRFSDDEMRAVLHLWRYIGYLLGIEEPLLPVDIDGALRSLYMVAVSQPEPDADSIELARALYEVPLTFAKTARARRIVQLEMGLRVSMTRRMLGDEGVDQLGLPRSRMAAFVLPLSLTIRGFEALRERLPFASYAAYRAGDYVLRRGQTVLDGALRTVVAADAARAA
jgi:hypothetical protein